MLVYQRVKLYKTQIAIGNKMTQHEILWMIWIWSVRNWQERTMGRCPGMGNPNGFRQLADLFATYTYTWKYNSHIYPNLASRKKMMQIYIYIYIYMCVQYYVYIYVYGIHIYIGLYRQVKHNLVVAKQANHLSMVVQSASAGGMVKSVKPPICHLFHSLKKYQILSR